MKDYDSAIADYYQVLKLNPNNADAYNNRGNAYKDLKDYDRAIADYTEAFKLDPNYLKAYVNRELAYRDLNRSLKLDPNNANVYNNRELPYRDLKDYDRIMTCPMISPILVNGDKIQVPTPASTTKSAIVHSWQTNDISSNRNVDYTRLRDLLAAGNWKEADYETRNSMLSVMGRKKGDLIEPEETLNFPCTDLCTIDRLWVKYSNGRFGFSVQKKIYLEVGGIPDGKYYAEAWLKFCDRVGWRVSKEPEPNGTWTTYWGSDYNDKKVTNITAKYGHLPLTMYFFMGGKHCWFFSRIQTCKL